MGMDCDYKQKEILKRKREVFENESLRREVSEIREGMRRLEGIVESMARKMNNGNGRMDYIGERGV